MGCFKPEGSAACVMHGILDCIEVGGVFLGIQDPGCKKSVHFVHRLCSVEHFQGWDGHESQVATEDDQLHETMSCS